MFSNQTPNYGLPQWENEDTPTWLSDMNGAFEDIDANLKRIEDKADEGGVPQEIIDRIVALETSVTNIVAKIGTDVIDTIGTSITNALVNLKNLIDTATTNITTLTTKIGNIDISDVGDSITQAIRNLADRGVPQAIIDRIVALETSVAGLTNQVENILTKIGTDVISSVGTSITNAIVNLKSAVDTATTNITTLTTKIGSDVIDTIGTSITNALVNLKNLIDTATTNITTLTTKIGNIDISDVGDSITRAIRNLADTGVPQTIIDRIVALETSVTNILTTIGADAISGIGTSITNAIVNLNTTVTNITTQIGNVTISWADSITDAIYKLGEWIDDAVYRITALETSVTNILTTIGADAISGIGTSITNAIVNLKNRIDNIMTLIGDTDISDVGDSITTAIRNLADTGVPQTIIDRIVALETSVTNIVAKIGTDVIDTIGTSITNAIVNLNTAITNIETKIGNISIYWDSITDAIGQTDITEFATSITEAIKKLLNLIDTKLNNNWTYLGILSASSGSTINVGDDWTELLLAIRVSEGSSYYNLTNVLPKEGFTSGNPNGNQTFAGFFWNESYNAKVRLGLEGTGSSRNLKLNYSNSVGWGINDIYVLKR